MGNISDSAPWVRPCVAAATLAFAGGAFASTVPGQRIGAEYRVNTITANLQANPAIAMDADGDYVVAWTGYSGPGVYEVYARRYRSDGSAMGAEFQVNTYGNDGQRSPAVAMNAAGNFVVAWASAGQDGSASGIFARSYAADGTPDGPEFSVNTFTAGDQSSPAVAMNAAGDFMIAWRSQDQDGSSGGIYAQRYGSGGAPSGAEFRVNAYVSGNQFAPAVAMAENGDVVIAWTSWDQDASLGGIYAQRYSADGAPEGGEFRVNTVTDQSQEDPALAMTADGRFVATWTSYAQAGSYGDVHAQRFDADGSAAGAEFRVNTRTASTQSSSAVAMNAAGDFVVTWTGSGGDNNGFGVLGQGYAADGGSRGGEFRVNAEASGHQQYAVVALDADGDFAAAWQVYCQTGSTCTPAHDSYEVYAQRFAGYEDVDLALLKTDARDPVDGGALLSYDIIVSNNHPVVATTGLPAIDSAIGGANTISAIDTLPPGVVFRNASGIDWACSHAAGTVTCAYAGTLAPMSSTAVTVDVTAPPGDAIVTNTASLSAAQYDANPANDGDSETTSVCANSGTLSFAAGQHAVAEGGTTTLHVTRSGGTCGAVSVVFASSDGGAVAGADYLATSGVLSWADWEGGTKSIELQTLPDALDEDAEVVTLALSGAVGGASIGTPATASVQIADDDAAPTVTIGTADAAADEGAAVPVIVELSAPSGRIVTVPFTLGGTASNGSDYSATPSPVTIPAGATSAVLVTLGVADDALDEDVETIHVTLGTPTHAGLGADTSFGLGIVDNDLAPDVSIATPDAAEQEASAGSNVVTVQLSAPSGRQVTVNFGISGSASPGGDYAIGASPIVIAPGATAATLATIAVQDDGLDEDDESVVVTLGSLVNGRAGADTRHVLTILDDDAPPTANFTSVAQTANEGGAAATVTVRLSTASGKTVSVPLALSGSASHPADYALSAQAIVIPAGALSGSVTVTVADDSKIELTESARFTMGSVTNGTAGAASSHTLTIKDNDPVPLP